MMGEINKCPLCECAVQESEEDYICPECHTNFSYVGGSAFLIKQVGHVSISALREAVQHMTGSYPLTPNL
ncbi:MAG: hypothetical protein ACXACY_23835 [Candidatus Hodarchaeales archaeon]|jgi:hypothetical protein